METGSAAVTDDIRVSADSHVSEPPDLWERELPAKYRDRALHFPNVELGKGLHARVGGWDPVERLKDMAADGSSAEVLYPTLAKSVFIQFFTEPLDLDLAKAGERVYNEWLIEYCQEAPDRLWGQAFLGLWDIDHAIHEMERAKSNGLKGVTTWVIPPDDLPWTGDHYERFWSAAEDLEMPISLHINTGFGAYVTRPNELRGENPVATASRQSTGHKIVIMQTLTDLLLSGVFERHPRLKVVLAEFEVGWIPFFLEDLDRKSGRHSNLGLRLLPSEYFTRNVFATFMQDAVGGYLLQRWGADNFMSSNDYPHGGGIWPFWDDNVALTLSGLTPEVRRKVVGETAARVYGMPMPTPLARRPRPAEADSIWPRPWLKKAGEFTFDKPKMGLAV